MLIFTFIRLVQVSFLKPKFLHYLKHEQRHNIMLVFK